ncbi:MULTISPECIES: hypothetical protein [unclassified Streptomyces]|uniref:hypothetical protein n=1 Tax=unclassified Streptomyces TaxID=2593676 RepID=UPI0034341668
MNRADVIAIAAYGLAALSVIAATVDHVGTHSALAARSPSGGCCRPPCSSGRVLPAQDGHRTVTKAVDKPVFGRSTLLGAYASGGISGGVYADDGSMTYTASDSTCSQEYAQISEEPTGGTVHRDDFMKACLTNVNDTAKTDSAP